LFCSKTGGLLAFWVDVSGPYGKEKIDITIKNISVTDRVFFNFKNLVDGK
jgi:hypothetical protein